MAPPPLLWRFDESKWVFVLWDDLKLTSGLRTPTAFNGQNYVFKIAGSKVLDKHYNSYLKK
jgi:hypothetical protein